MKKDEYLDLRNKLRPPKERTGFVRPKSKEVDWRSLKKEVLKNLNSLKTDLTWTDLPDIDKLPKGKIDKDEAIAMVSDLLQTTPTGALAGVIKEKGGNWLNESVKKALERLKRPESEPREGGHLFNSNMVKVKAMNKWVDGPLQKYVQNRMATPDDEIRKLADQGILHVDPYEQLNFNLEQYGKYPIKDQKFIAGSDFAKIWEGSADNSISYGPAEEFYGKAFIDQYPWIEKIDPKAPIYTITEPQYLIDDLGFEHLIDELLISMDEASGFPQHLRMTPESLQGLSIEEAIRKVDGINKFRAEKVAKANARFAAAEGIPIYKEYDDGWRWLEYKKTQEADSETKLADWLKSEGDTMGHCVGGYCEDVAQGHSRILSLRDPDGKSISTIELSPHIDYSDPESQQWMINQIKGPGNRKPDERAMKYLQDFVRSGDWADVKDLENTGLLKHRNSYLTPKEMINLPMYQNSLLDFDITNMSDKEIIRIINSIDDGAY